MRFMTWLVASRPLQNWPRVENGMMNTAWDHRLSFWGNLSVRDMWVFLIWYVSVWFACEKQTISVVRLHFILDNRVHCHFVYCNLLCARNVLFHYCSRFYFVLNKATDCKILTSPTIRGKLPISFSQLIFSHVFCRKEILSLRHDLLNRYVKLFGIPHFSLFFSQRNNFFYGACFCSADKQPINRKI